MKKTILIFTLLANFGIIKAQITSDLSCIQFAPQSKFHNLLFRKHEEGSDLIKNPKLNNLFTVNQLKDDNEWTIFKSKPENNDFFKKIKANDGITVGKYSIWGNPKNPLTEIEFAKGWIGSFRISTNIILPINKDNNLVDAATTKLISNGGSVNLNTVLPLYIRQGEWNKCQIGFTLSSSYKVGANIPALGTFSDSLNLSHNLTILEAQFNILSEEFANSTTLSRMGLSLFGRLTYTKVDQGAENILGIKDKSKGSMGITVTGAIQAGQRVKIIIIKQFLGTNYINLSKKPMIGLALAI